MERNFYRWELAKIKANLKSESNMKVFWNACKRERSWMKYVNENYHHLKTSKGNSLLEKFM